MNKTTDNPFQRIKIGLFLIVSLIGIAVVTHLWTQNQQKITTTVNSTQEKAYQHWAKYYLKTTDHGHTKFVVTNDGVGTTKTLSEAQGYGMLASVLAAKKGASSQADFNALVNYYLKHRLSATNHLMAWRQSANGQQMATNKNDHQSATDGDLDIAYALIQADALWGSKKVNYRLYAKQLLNNIMRHEINQRTWLPTVGDWAIGSKATIVRTSDLIPYYFTAFAKFTNNHNWNKVATNSRQTLSKLSQQNSTGLIPDFVKATQTGLTTVASSSVSDDNANLYSYNACRLPWRLAASYQASHNKTDRRVLQKMLTFFNSRSKILTNYQLDGTATTNNQDLAFTAPIAVGAKVLKQTVLSNKTQTSLTGSIQKNHYYSQTVRLLSELTE